METVNNQGQIVIGSKVKEQDNENIYYVSGIVKGAAILVDRNMLYQKTVAIDDLIAFQRTDFNRGGVGVKALPPSLRVL